MNQKTDETTKIKPIKDFEKGAKFTDIKGKKYAMVHEKLRVFWLWVDANEFNVNEQTDVLERTANEVLMRTTITVNKDGFRRQVTGIAHETREGMINKTSMEENCETSAVGRALSKLGVLTDNGFASGDEVNNAIRRGGENKGSSKYGPYVKPVDSIYGLSLEDAQKLSKATPEKVRTLIKDLGLSRGFYHIGDFMSLHVRNEETMLRALSCFEGVDIKVSEFLGGAKWSILESIKAIKEHTDKGTLEEFEKECIAGTAVPF